MCTILNLMLMYGYRVWFLLLGQTVSPGAKVLMDLHPALLPTTNRVLVLPNGNS